MENFQKVVLILALLFYFFAAAPRGAAQTETLLFVDPQVKQVQEGEAFSVAINVADVEDLYGFALQVAFDPACLQVNQSLPAPLVLGDFLTTGGFNGPQGFDNDLGLVRFDYTQVSPATPQSGSGRLLVIHFIAREVNCTSGVTIEEGGKDPTILVHAEDYFKIPFTVHNGSVAVRGESPAVQVYLPLFISNSEGSD